MQVVKDYTPEQLANAEKMFTALSALPEGKQKTVTMVANAFMESQFDFVFPVEYYE